MKAYAVVCALIVCVCAVDAFTLHSPVRRFGAKVGRFSSIVTDGESSAMESDDEPAKDDSSFMTWQQSLEKLINPFTPIAEKQIMAQDLVARREEVIEDVKTIAREGTPENLFPEDSELRRATLGTKAVSSQVLNDIVPTLLEVPSNGAKLASLGSDAAVKSVESLQKTSQQVMESIRTDGTDAAANMNFDEIVSTLNDELANVFTSTPRNLMQPEYTVIKTYGQVEIREYARYGVVTTNMNGGDAAAMDDFSQSTESLPKELSDPLRRGQSFNVLASYIFGDNSENKQLKMTTPVTMLYKYGVPQTMSFVLGGDEAVDAPNPTSARVFVSEKESQTIASKEFLGFATAGEIARQVAEFRQLLAETEYMSIDDFQTYEVLQYNPPYTIPVIRRNEIHVRVTTDPARVLTSSSTSTPEPVEVIDGDDGMPSD